MGRRVKGWSLAAVGALIVFGAVWFGATVYTLLKQRADETRITQIHREVVVLRRDRHHHPRKEVVAGSGSHSPHGQPSPGHAPGGGTVGNHQGHSGGEGAPSGATPAASSPAPASGAAGRTQPEQGSVQKPELPSVPAPVPTPHLPLPAAPVVERATETATGTVQAVEGTACSLPTSLCH